MRPGLLALLSIGCTSTLPFYEPLCVEADGCGSLGATV